MFLVWMVLQRAHIHLPQVRCSPTDMWLVWFDHLSWSDLGTWLRTRDIFFWTYILDCLVIIHLIRTMQLMISRLAKGTFCSPKGLRTVVIQWRSFRFGVRSPVSESEACHLKAHVIWTWWFICLSFWNGGNYYLFCLLEAPECLFLWNHFVN